MGKKYLQEIDKSSSDAIWSLLIAILVTFYRQAPSFVYALTYMIAWFVQIFLIFFLWSWKKEDVQSYRARCLLNTTFWGWVIFGGMMACLMLYSVIFIRFDYEILFSALLSIVMTVLVAKKYRSLMCIH
ncbi:hypothetical protein HYV10_00010 [Candidatus Dependentiae bacterium]|nr:hypothetical protein [Candidatus Dependentiae bacterium]